MLGSYLQIDSLIGLDVHTDETLTMIEEELVVFGDELHVCILYPSLNLTTEPANNLSKKYIKFAKRSGIETLKLDWNFPKVHLWKHVVHDIRIKGVARNYSTRPNEKMHSALKDAYADRSNGKDIEKQVWVFFSTILTINLHVLYQILRVDHHRLAIKLLKGRVEAESVNDEHQSASTDGDATEIVESVADMSAAGAPTRIHLGSPCPPSTVAEIEDVHRGDHAFEGFRRKFTEFINHCLPSYGTQLGGWTRFEPTFKVCLYILF